MGGFYSPVQRWGWPCHNIAGTGGNMQFVSGGPVDHGVWWRPRSRSRSHALLNLHYAPGLLFTQARGSLPSNFDCDLGYTLGMTAAHLAHGKCNGYLAIATGLKDSATSWSVGGLPLVSMLHAEDSTAPPVIPPARVELTGKAHAAMRAASADWVVEELYENPGPLQFGGATADNRSLTLQLEADPGYLQGLSSLHQELEAVRAACRPGCPSQQLQVIAQSLATLTNMIGLFHGEDVSSAANPLKRRRVVPL